MFSFFMRNGKEIFKNYKKTTLKSLNCFIISLLKTIHRGKNDISRTPGQDCSNTTKDRRF